MERNAGSRDRQAAFSLLAVRPRDRQCRPFLTGSERRFSKHSQGGRELGPDGPGVIPDTEVNHLLHRAEGENSSDVAFRIRPEVDHEVESGQPSAECVREGGGGVQRRPS